MKIIKPPSNRNNKYREIANKDCNVCPYCGSKDDKINYLGEKIYMTIYDGVMVRYKNSFVSKYRCIECEAEWQSEPY